jgi:hypothetical protein
VDSQLTWELDIPHTRTHTYTTYMCGITCAVALRGHGPLVATQQHQHGGGSGGLSEMLEESLDTIRHRGPDAKGCWISEDARVGMLQKKKHTTLPTWYEL